MSTKDDVTSTGYFKKQLAAITRLKAYTKDSEKCTDSEANALVGLMILAEIHDEIAKLRHDLGKRSLN